MRKQVRPVFFLSLLSFFCAAHAADPQSPILFELRTLPFRLENSETPARNAPETMPGGLAVFDYNGDGRPDIFFTNGGNISTLKKDDPKYRNRLYRNDGNGVFTDVTVAAGVAGTRYDMGVAVADYDNDGHPDMFVAGLHHGALYHNNGDGTFSDVTVKSGLDASINNPDPEFGPWWEITAVWVDVNNDGLVDLFVAKGNVAKMPDFAMKDPNNLLLQGSDGKFVDAGETAGIVDFANHRGAALTDLNLDGLIDLVVVNRWQNAQVWRNTSRNAGRWDRRTDR